MSAPGAPATHPVSDVVPVDSELLTFGIEVFQAVMAGAMPVDDYDGADLPCIGMDAISRQVGGHGLTPQEEASLVLRVVAFGDLLGQAEHDTRIAGHVAPAHAGGYQITTAFLQAAAGADIVRRDDGGFAYDLESVAARLVH